ncbi:hypothetical protein A3T98_21755 [Salmonella enterica subsp. enterica serovar Newport]|nr:hypothetical protein [Salmonella enterica subsp. enterica serovar Newport]EEF6915876.1 hypothetical protein [Salmonella enterica]EHJ0380296.1 hypothetical protein [Salmonella enterica]
MTSRTSEAENTTTGTHDRVEFVGVPVGHHAQPDNFNLERFEYQVTLPDTESGTIAAGLVTGPACRAGLPGFSASRCVRHSLYIQETQVSAAHLFLFLRRLFDITYLQFLIFSINLNYNI